MKPALDFCKTCDKCGKKGGEQFAGFHLPSNSFRCWQCYSNFYKPEDKPKKK